MNGLRIELRNGSRSEAREIAEELAALVPPESITTDAPDGDEGVAPFVILIVVATGIVGLGVITRLVDWFRDRRSCLLVVDARLDEVTITERCDLEGQRGKIILIASTDTQISIEMSKGVIDLDRIVETAISGSIAAAVDLVKAAGGTAEIQASGEGL